MKNRFLYIALLLSIGVLILLGRIYIRQNKEQLRYTGEVERTYRVIITLHNCEQLLTDAESAQRGYLVSTRPAFRAAYSEAIARIDSVIGKLRETTSDNPKQRVHMKLLEPAIAARIALMDLNLARKDSNKISEIDLLQSKLLMDKIREYGNEIEKEEYMLLEFRNHEKDHYRQLNDSFLRYTFIAAGFVFLASVFMILRELRTRVRVQKMLEKTIFELKQSQEEIGQVSFAASHDLQEPLRKIRTMSTLLIKKYGPHIASEEKDIIQRIDRSTEQLHNRLENLIDFINLVSHPEQSTQVNLEHVFRYAFAKTSAEIPIVLYKTEQLPLIQGYEQQLTLLFLQLLSNAVRYRHPERPLEITLSYEIGENSISQEADRTVFRPYHKITITDNGIGFDQTFNEKIFQLFQRLHSKEAYAGQGIGLTIARRIMTNHYGFIRAAGIKDESASFTLWFPAA